MARCRQRAARASRPHAGGVSQSKAPLSSRVGIGRLDRLALGRGRGGTRHTGQKAGDLLEPGVEAVDAARLDHPAGAPPGRPPPRSRGIRCCCSRPSNCWAFCSRRPPSSLSRSSANMLQQPRVAALERRHGLGNRAPPRPRASCAAAPCRSFEPSSWTGCGAVLELQGRARPACARRLRSHAFDRCAARPGWRSRQSCVGGAFGIELLEGAAHDLGLVLLAVDLRRIDAVEHRRAHQVGMAAHDLERPARAVGDAVEVDARQAPWRLRGRPRRRPAPASCTSARSILRLSKSARQRTRMSRSCCSVIARRRACAGSVVRGSKQSRLGVDAAGAALAQDDDVAAAADGGGLVPPVAFGQRVGAGGRRHQRRIARAAARDRPADQAAPCAWPSAPPPSGAPRGRWAARGSPARSACSIRSGRRAARLKVQRSRSSRGAASAHVCQKQQEYCQTARGTTVAIMAMLCHITACGGMK